PPAGASRHAPHGPRVPGANGGRRHAPGRLRGRRRLRRSPGRRALPRRARGAARSAAARGDPADLALQRDRAARPGQRVLPGAHSQRAARRRLLHPDVHRAGPGGLPRHDVPHAAGARDAGPPRFARARADVKQSRGMSRRARAILATACGAHFVHDGFSDILYILLPVWATEFGLSFAQVGLLKTLYTGGMASFQVPAGILAERRGEARLLAAGTAVTALGFLAAGLAGGFLALLVCLAVGGLGSGCQHPLSSSLVSRAYETGPRRTALVTSNFSGDLGKVAVPAAVARALPWLGWRRAVEVYAVIGLLAAAAILALLGRLGAGQAEAPVPASATAPRAAGWGA